MSTTANRSMKNIVAEAANLLNANNMLSGTIRPQDIMSELEKYIWSISDDGLDGMVRVEQVSWYQWDVSHLSVRPKVRRRGIGAMLVERAENFARRQGGLLAQCTIRVGNEASMSLFVKRGFVPGATFYNPYTDRNIQVFQKALSGNSNRA